MFVIIVIHSYFTYISQGSTRMLGLGLGHSLRIKIGGLGLGLDTQGLGLGCLGLDT